jgi:hypothetical protein
MIEPELIARVLEGRATPEERQRVLAAADQSPELLALLADSAAALNEGERSAATVLPMRARFARPALWVGIAAVLVAAVTLPRVWSRSAIIPALGIEGIGSSAAIPAARLGPALDVRRGAGDENRIAISARVGARIVDYASLGADTARATVAAEIAASLREIPAGGIVASGFDNAPPLTPEMIASVEGLLDARTFRAAGWAETVRLAAMARDDRALGDSDVAQAFDRLASHADNSAIRELATRVRSSLTASADRSELADLAARLLSVLSRPR